MARSLPPLTWFRAFESAARQLSFTAAADELGLTQSAISQHVRSLEHRFGCALFVRKHRGLALTDDGRRLLPTVTNAIGTLRSAAEGFDTTAEKGILTIAASVSIAQWYLVPRMKAFIDANEGTTIRLVTKVWPDEFSGSVADVEIRFDSPESASRDSSLLGSNSTVVVASPDLVPDVPAHGLSCAQINTYPLVQVVGTSDTWQVWAKNRRYDQDLNACSYVDSHGMAVDLAKAGFGVALTSSVIAAPSLLEGSLRLLEPMASPARDGYHLHLNPGVSSDLPLKFADWLQSEVAATEAKMGLASPPSPGAKHASQ